MKSDLEEFLSSRVAQSLDNKISHEMLYGTQLHKTFLGKSIVSDELYAFWEHGDPHYHEKLKVLKELGT